MSEQVLQALTEERFAKLFGRLQRQLGEAIEAFLAEVAPGKPDVWMDDTRALAILEIAQGDASLHMRTTEPATWWQHLKQDRYPAWLLRLFPVRRAQRPCDHLPWPPWSEDRLGAFRAHVRQQIEKELSNAPR